GAGSIVEFDGATVIGGALTATNGGVFVFNESTTTTLVGTVDNALSIDASLDISGNVAVVLEGLIDNTGTIDVSTSAGEVAVLTVTGHIDETGSLNHGT